MDDICIIKINKHKKIYKEWIKTDVSNVELYPRPKEGFKSYYNTIRRSTKEAKRLYYTRTFALYKNNITQTWTIIKDTLPRKSKCKVPNQFFTCKDIKTFKCNICPKTFSLSSTIS